LSTARALKAALRDVADVTVWDEPGAGFDFNESIFGGLLAATEQFDFAVFVFEADDLVSIRRRGNKRQSAMIVRDNVIFEFGLFVRSIGRNRAFWVSPAGAKKPSLPTDLAGLFSLRYKKPKAEDAMLAAVADAIKPLAERIRKLGRRTDRTLEELSPVRLLCASSTQYDAPQFEKDHQEIRGHFPSDSITVKEGISADELDALMFKNRWDIIHLATYVDIAIGDVILPASGAANNTDPNRLLAKGFVDLVNDCGARLVVIPTCDSIALALKLSPITNVISGHKPIEARSALTWAKVFYRNLARGVSLNDSYKAAQHQADCGLVLLLKRDFRLALQQSEELAETSEGAIPKPIDTERQPAQA
jgi:hypothetical protein